MMPKVGDYVYIKFGVHHGKKAKIVGESWKGVYPSFILELENGKLIEKKQRNTVKVVLNHD